ncbi:hypothetical protein H6F93_32725 [Leptolyngbya sp. FACHB-671]|uniref:hypothetical protein n=1 Tax=Leptolyngbya sp. FACHB-671 TaxID=2692812 RepID=UPI00168866E1|nr:hypothetical protein [Leptolyngbya sp. FACHB-671]MBD2072237.1 hypothetical protein [Leptolyngbya sp. FACHB-671]
MSLIICPGIHPPELTASFLAGLEDVTRTPLRELTNYFIFPSDRYPPYSAFHILETLYAWIGKPCKNSEQPDQNLSTNLLPSSSHASLVFLSFSAGVVGAIGAARTWQRSGGQVKAFIAVDGWGVPLRGEFPLYRLSHDFFTHWSSAPLGAAAESFYADPPVPHLELWRSPQTVWGYQLKGEERSPSLFPNSPRRAPITAAAFLIDLLTRQIDSRLTG